jgi:hypothetical protein
MSEQFYRDLVEVVDAFEVSSAGEVSFRRERVDVAAGTDPGWGAGHPLPPDPLVRVLQAVLYTRCYARRLGAPEDPTGDAPPEPTAFALELAAGNQTRDRWDAGWQVVGVSPNGQVTVQKGEVQRAALPGEYATEAAVPGVPVRVGSVVSVVVRREAFGAQPGLYFAYSDTLSDVWDEYALVRLYFNVRSADAAALVKQLTAALNRFQVPFRLKAPVVPASYWRTDGIVLYVAQRYYPIAARLAVAAAAGLPRGLRPPTPLFSKTVAPGIGLAEEPNTGESFGMHRCRLTAEGIVDAWRQGRTATADKVRAVGGRFAQAGVVLAAPHLSTSKVDTYEVPLP